MAMTPEEKEAWLDEPEPGLYYHRDGTPVKTRREGLAIWAADDDPTHPDHRFIARDTVIVRRPPRRISELLSWRGPRNEVTVSTVFLIIDHGFGAGTPILFETMVFGGDSDGWATRYATEAEARAGHAEVVAWVKKRREPEWT